MRHLSFWVFCLAASTALANSPSTAVPREAEFDGCHFKLYDLYNGSLTLTTDGAPPVAVYSVIINPELLHSVEVSIRFTCDTAEGMRAFTELGFDNQSGVWKLIPNEHDPENLARVKLYPLTGNGTSGAASTDDQTMGEETERTQGLAFCLTNQKQILCGTSQAVGYLAYPEESSLPQVLELLESIEFLEPTPSTAP